MELPACAGSDDRLVFSPVTIENRMRCFVFPMMGMRRSIAYDPRPHPMLDYFQIRALRQPQKRNDRDRFR